MKYQLLLAILLIGLASVFCVDQADACDVGQYCPIQTPDGMKTCSMGSDGIFRCMG